MPLLGKGGQRGNLQDVDGPCKVPALGFLPQGNLFRK